MWWGGVRGGGGHKNVRTAAILHLRKYTGVMCGEGGFRGGVGGGVRTFWPLRFFISESGRA